MIETKWAVLLASGDRIRINACDFDPSVHAEDSTDSPEQPQEGSSGEEQPEAQPEPESPNPEQPDGSADGSEEGSCSTDEGQDVTPGGVSTVNAVEANALIAAATTIAELDVMAADEVGSKRHPEGRKGVLSAIAKRRAELA